jgi:hypothetical protein
VLTARLARRTRPRDNPHMIGWIACGVAYVGCILFVRWLGGIGAAEDALRSWGEASSRRRRRVSSSSSS